jgi:hypothetical protein
MSIGIRVDRDNRLARRRDNKRFTARNRHPFGRSVRLLTIACLLVAVTFAGCAGKADATESENARITTEAGAFDFLEGMGVVKGSVVDDRAYPLPASSGPASVRRTSWPPTVLVDSSSLMSNQAI